MTSWVVGIWKKKSQFFVSFADFFQIFLKKSQLFQNSANLFVLKFKCVKFQTKKILENSRKFCKITQIYLSWNSSVLSFRQKKILHKSRFLEIFDFVQIFLKKSQMFQNSANLFVLKFKCAKFQTQKKFRKIPKNLENFDILKFLKESQMFQNSENLFVLKFKCAKFQKKKNSREIPKIFKNFKIFQILLKKSQMFQNSANLFVLKFKCAKFQTKKISKKWPLE